MDFLYHFVESVICCYCLAIIKRVYLTVLIFHAAKLYYADLYILSTDFEWLFPVQFPASETLKWWRPFGRPLKYGTAFFHRDQWYMGVCIVVGYDYRGIADLLPLPSFFQRSIGAALSRVKSTNLNWVRLSWEWPKLMCLPSWMAARIAFFYTKPASLILVVELNPDCTCPYNPSFL